LIAGETVRFDHEMNEEYQYLTIFTPLKMPANVEIKTTVVYRVEIPDDLMR
jgi:hypothetical protein